MARAARGGGVVRGGRDAAGRAEKAARRGRRGNDASPRLQLVDLRDDAELARSPLLPGFRHLPYTKWQTWAVDAIDGSSSRRSTRALETNFMDHRGGRGERIMQYLAQSGGFGSARFVRGGINAYAEEADQRCRRTSRATATARRATSIDLGGDVALSDVSPRQTRDDNAQVLRVCSRACLFVCPLVSCTL